MKPVKLYFDENVPETIAAAVRLRGYDVITVRDAERKAASDLEQFRYALAAAYPRSRQSRT